MILIKRSSKSTSNSNNIFNVVNDFYKSTNTPNVQKQYDDYILRYTSNDFFEELCCPNPNCKHKISNARRSSIFHIHGTYERSLYLFFDTNLQKVTLAITRLKCKFCGKTNALLPENIIPYVQTNYADVFRELHYYHDNTKSAPKVHFDDEIYSYIIDTFDIDHNEYIFQSANNISAMDFINSFISDGVEAIVNFFNVCHKPFLSRCRINNSANKNRSGNVNCVFNALLM